ncbi:ABC transporter permease subunit [Isoptericola aurantiacus]|uniref:ABC transporter permease subunit n=1 Tax=Isoptericola aurantiacus TaxID=3377839 RepID=UPI00383BE872
MRRLLRVELRRLWARRVTWGACLLALVAVGLGVAAQVGDARPPTAAETAQAEQWYADELEWWEEDGEEQVATCLEDQEADPDPGADYGCDQMEPRLEYFLPPTVVLFPDAAEREAQGDLAGEPAEDVDPAVAEVQQSFWNGWSGLPAAATTALFFLMLAFVVGVSFVTAEQSSGSLGMWLTFEPRRRRVYWSKAVAAALGTLPVVVGGWALLVGGLVALYAVFGTVGDPTAEAWVEVATFTGRLALAGMLLAGVGAALAVLLRNAAAAIGVPVVVVWAASAFSYSLGASQRWLPGLNLDAWLRGGATYGYGVPVRLEDGTFTEEWVERAVSTGQGGLYLLGVAVVITVLAVVVFRRRDVS